MTDIYLDEKKVLEMHFISIGCKVNAVSLEVEDGSLYIIKDFRFLLKKLLSTNGQKMILTNEGYSK